MTKKKSFKEESKTDIPEIKEQVVEEKPVQVVESKYILKKDVTKQFKKGMEMPEEMVKRLISTGTNVDGWFE